MYHTMHFNMLQFHGITFLEKAVTLVSHRGFGGDLFLTKYKGSRNRKLMYRKTIKLNVSTLPVITLPASAVLVAIELGRS